MRELLSALLKLRHVYRVITAVTCLRGVITSNQECLESSGLTKATSKQHRRKNTKREREHRLMRLTKATNILIKKESKLRNNLIVDIVRIV